MNGTYGTTGTTTALQVTGSRMIDDFLRRELRVGDPRNAVEVVTALRKRYAADAARIDQEVSGLPVRYEAQPVALPAVTGPATTPAMKEERRVLMDLDSDLAALVDSRDNREWATEIRGWRDTLLREFAEGSAAARLAQDPAMRDRGFLAVRKLGEFARVARLVGVMNLPLNTDYRRLATTLDNAANVVRIMMGEALFNAGLSEGGFIIQVPVFELRDRRDALVFAVRRLSGTEIDTENDDWGDALEAYRALLNELQLRGASELRVYLRADLLAAILDGLVGEVARQDPDALRQVAATSPVEVARMSRLFDISSRLLGSTPTGPITAALALYVRSLQLFLDGFAETRSGARLIDLAMPLPLAAQQADEPDREGRRILRDLVSVRGEYAREVECFLSGCSCGGDDLKCQVQLDKVLYDVDRAIDLYAQGSGIPPTFGVEEQRASVYGLIARNLANEGACVTPVAAFEVLLEGARSALDLIEAVEPIDTTATARITAGFLRHAIVAAEAGAASRTVSEGIRRALFLVPTLIETDVNTNTHLLFEITETARAVPLGIEEAILVLIDVIEFAVGVTTSDPSSDIADDPADAIPDFSIAGVDRGEMADGYDFVGLAIDGAGGLSTNLDIAVDALFEARVALRAAMLAIADVTGANIGPNRQAALDQAEDVRQAIDEANQALNTPPVTATEVAALNGAIDAATVTRAMALRVGRLPLSQGIEPITLGQTLNELAALLQTAQPGDQSVVQAVFEEQFRSEHDWEILVRSLAPRCLGPGQSELVLAGLELLRASPRFKRDTARTINLPAEERVSLASLATDLGRNRQFTVVVPDDNNDVDRESGTGRVRRGRRRRGRRSARATQRRKSAPALPAVLRARGTVAVPAPREADAPRPRVPTTAGLPPLRDFVQQIAPYSRTRGEMRAAVEEHPELLRQWEEIKTKYPAAGQPLDREFVTSVDDLFDPAKPAKLTVEERKRLQSVLQQAVYPFPLSK